jgi:photosystem II stability/assembly factor-like uncharacterized protein
MCGAGPRRHSLGQWSTIALAVFIGMSPPARAADSSPAWTLIGPPRGVFRSWAAAASDPDILYASDDSADIWTSTDGGSAWSFLRRLTTPDMRQGGFAGVNPAQASIVFWASFSQYGGAGLYRSSDGGVTWQLVLGGSLVYSSVVMSPAAPQTAWVYLNDGSIQRSDDAGLTWRSVSALPFYVFAGFTLAVDPTNPDILYAAGQPGVAKSTDGGSHWSQVFTFSSQPFDSVGILLFVAPSSPSTLILATTGFSIPTADDRVFRSDDAGATWAEIDAGLPGPPHVHVGFAVGATGAVYAAVGDPQNPGTSIQIYQEVGTGDTWQQTAVLPFGQGILRVDHANPERVYALGSAGILRSADLGHSFVLPAKPPSSVAVNQVLFGPGSSQSLYVAAADEAFPPLLSTFNHSADGGATWTASFPPLQDSFGLFPSYIRLVLDAQPGTIYSLTSPSTMLPVSFSHDDGASWQALALPPFRELPLALVADPQRSGRLTELGCRYVEIPIPHTTFEQVLCTALRLYTTNTAGRHWRRIANLHLPKPLSAGADLRLDPKVPSTVYVMFAGSLYRSTAADPQLAPLALPGSVIDVAIDPTQTATAYAAAAGTRRPVFKSTNGGVSWTSASAGLPRGLAVAGLAVDPNSTSTVYAVASQGLFVSRDGASTWQPVDIQGLPASVPLATVAVSPAGGAIYLGTVGGGLYSRPPGK